MERKTRYALVGTGSRAAMYIDPVVTRFRDSCQLVGLCDPNPARLAYHNRRLAKELGYQEVPAYDPDRFDAMISETRPDTVIVTTIDALHHKYVIRAMELGCDAITEKPMTTDAEKCAAILETVESTGKQLRVAFNYRWGSGATTVRKMLAQGIIGDIIHVDLDYMLDTSHGADYFRRWHREKDKSGGLLVHKATHHFDMVNWWIDAVPETVFGMGRLAFYGRENAERRGVGVKYGRYHGSDTGDDPFAIDLTANETNRGLYLDAEKYDGYVRDRNVFGDNITIEDTMSVLVSYRTGVVLNYSLNAYLPREGFQIAFNGTKGRMEYSEIHSALIRDQTKRSGHEESGKHLVIRPLFSEPYEVEILKAEGGHGGGDPLLQAQIFDPDATPDPVGRDAGHGQGAASILIGIAANKSFETGQPVRISEICPALDGAIHLSGLA